MVVGIFDMSPVISYVPLALICSWLAAGVLSAGGTSCLETAHAAGILLLVGAGVLFWGGSARMAASAAGRLWTTGVLVAGTLVLSPLFQQGASSQGLGPSGQAAQWSVVLSCTAALLLWITGRALGDGWKLEAGGLSVCDAQAGRAPQSAALGQGLESFILARRTRLHIAAAWVLLVLAEAGLGGLPLRAALLRAGFVVLLVLCLPVLLALAAVPSGQRAMYTLLALALSLSAAVGAARYIALRGEVNAIRSLLHENREKEAEQVYQAALDRNAILCAQGKAAELEACWAAYRERTGAFDSALDHWRRIAEQRGADPTEMLPVRRILCEMGDSLNSWRRLIYQGFPAITDPEIAPGVKALGDNPKGDLRAKLLAALLAWEQQEPPEELKRRLELVRKACPNEASACNLLNRLGSAVADTDLWLPHELIIGRRLSSASVLGTIEDLGEVDTVVVLNEGHWEVCLKARGTPLHEEWPIVRLELNGKVIGRTQVNRVEDHEVPFTLDVNHGNIYHVKIIFENRMEDIVQGRVSRRGLTINGLRLRRAKG